MPAALRILVCFLSLNILNLFGSVKSDSILVLIDEKANQDDYNQFWNSLKGRNHQVSFRSTKSSTPTLTQFDQPAFQHLIVFCPTTKSFPPDLSPQSLVGFLEVGGNILFAGSTNISEYWRDFAREFDLDFDESSTAVVDHFQHLADDPTKIYANLDATPLIEDQVIIPPSVRKSSPPVLFRGIGHGLGKNPLLMSVLRASPVAYSTEPQSSETDPNPFIIGDEIGLISALQTRHQSRISFVGSLDFFSDAFFTAEITLPGGKKSPTANKKIADLVTKWTFQESGVLRILSATHSKINGEKEPKRYRVNEQIDYKVDIQMLQDGKWGPSPVDDIQLEFSMLDPHLRVTLTPSKSSKGNYTTYSTVFRAPDRHGVFTFNLDYRRRNGLTHLKNDLQVSVTPLEHDQYERFILSAYPYYAGAFSVWGSFIVFCIVWLTHSPAPVNKKTN
ncbi:hypothetical protein O181_041335 [Austropuccinia psidii MF-1]|uniref:Dolichyl-diphosphooligosaccharide--protein glycosyltransferase subunit WBP1 n=1 Tax=Austropuccinia psidii MF-1 TaxID=1389203 RepID=A0A9Q3DIH2_9BASI|nr:hypothetical protein [Austropuccinia psidii MF-1]